jgi:hypothetical protein
MKDAPRDGTILELRHVSRQLGEVIFRARWLTPRRVWVDWDRQHVALDKAPLRGWRVAPDQFRQWTPDEVAILAEMHGPATVTYLDRAAWDQGQRVPVPQP